MRQPYNKRWPRKNLGDLVSFLEEINPQGINVTSLANRLGGSAGNISNMFCRDDMKLSKAEQIARAYGYKLLLYFPKRDPDDTFGVAPFKLNYPNAGNLTGLVEYIRDSGYSITFFSEQSGIGRNILQRAFTNGDISLATLNHILDTMGLCVIWKFIKN